MNETTHWCEDKDTLIDYLYGELDAEGRRVFEGHLRTCIACAREVEALRGVREDLATWLPPEAELGFTIAEAADTSAAPIAAAAATVLHPPQWAWSSVPAWARAAAAILVVGAGLGLANVQVRSTADGLRVSTGWMTPAPPVTAASSAAPVAADANPTSTAAWRPELAALEGDLRKEMQALRATAPGAVPVTAARSSGADDQALLRRVQALIEDSERRQEKSLAIRMGQFGRDLEMQRRVDLARVEQGFGRFEGRTAADLVRQRQMIDYLVRVSATKVP